jgi:hypothetical protein
MQQVLNDRCFDTQQVEIAGQAVADLIARISHARTMVQRKVNGLGMYHFATLADIGHIAGGHNAGHILFSYNRILQFNLARQTIAARFSARETCDDVIDPNIGHLLRGLHSRADSTLCFVHYRYLAKSNTPRFGGGGADHPKVRLTGHRADAICLACLLQPVEAQDQAGDLGGAHVQNGDDAALHGGFAHIAHGAL